MPKRGIDQQEFQKLFKSIMKNFDFKDKGAYKKATF
jgi:hypothetical protein